MATVEVSPRNEPHTAPAAAKADGGAAESIMDRWRTFFKLTGAISESKMRLHAIAKLTQIALVQYMRLREGVYDPKIFVKKRYNDLAFFTLNTKEETGAQLNDVLTTACKFIGIEAVKAVRFQVFHDPSKPNEVGEEVVFQFYYGNNPQATIEFGSTGNVVLDMTDCSFDSFLRCFGEMLGRIRAYCTHLRPLPNDCEKRIRSSFCKRLPPDFETGHFNHVRGPVSYAPDMVAREIGDARLEGVAVAAILRTCYTNEEFDRVIDEAIAESIRNETNEIFGQGKRNEQVEEVRQTQAADTSYANVVVDEQSVVSATTIPQRDDTIPRSEGTRSPSHAETIDQLRSIEQTRSAVQSPAFDRMSIISTEAILPRNPQRPPKEPIRKTVGQPPNATSTPKDDPTVRTAAPGKKRAVATAAKKGAEKTPAKKSRR